MMVNLFDKLDLTERLPKQGWREWGDERVEVVVEFGDLGAEGFDPGGDRGKRPFCCSGGVGQRPRPRCSFRGRWRRRVGAAGGSQSCTRGDELGSVEIDELGTERVGGRHDQ